MISLFFFFNDTATTEIYTLSLHDALPICEHQHGDPQRNGDHLHQPPENVPLHAIVLSRPKELWSRDRKSTRLNSSHVRISYAVFCLKKKKIKPNITRIQMPY